MKKQSFMSKKLAAILFAATMTISLFGGTTAVYADTHTSDVVSSISKSTTSLAGNKYYSVKDSQSYEYTVAYNENASTLLFTATEGKYTVTMTYDIATETVSNDKLACTFASVTSPSDLTIASTADIKTTEYVYGDTLTFTVNSTLSRNTDNISDTTIQKNFNTATKNGMYYWNALLKDKTGYGMKDIGFTSFEGKPNSGSSSNTGSLDSLEDGTGASVSDLLNGDSDSSGLTTFTFGTTTVTGTKLAENNGYTFIKDAKGDVRCYDADGNQQIDCFMCDGTYTYFFQHDGTAMESRLTYHPDGVHIIYFDANGHEVFSDYAHVTQSIAGSTVDDYCFFDVYGYMYVDVLTYDKSGTYLLYANPYGVLERSGWFQFSSTVIWADGTPCDGIANGYGYGKSDCHLLTNTTTKDWNGNTCYLQANGVAKY